MKCDCRRHREYSLLISKLYLCYRRVNKANSLSFWAKKEQPAIIYLCTESTPGTEIHRQLLALKGNRVLLRSYVYGWIAKLRRKWTGRPLSIAKKQEAYLASNTEDSIEQECTLILTKWMVTIDGVANHTQIKHCSLREFIHIRADFQNVYPKCLPKQHTGVMTGVIISESVDSWYHSL